MDIFKQSRDGSALSFHVVDISDKQLTEIANLVTDNGGVIGQSDLPFLFTSKSSYEEKKALYPLTFRVYDIEFIKICVRKGRLVNMRPYRLTPKKLGEKVIISLFINGEDDQDGSLEDSPSLSQLQLSPPKLKESCEDVPDGTCLTESRPVHLEKNPLSSQDTYHTAIDEVMVKRESVSSPDWEPIPRSPESQGFFKSSSDPGRLVSSTMIHQTPDNSRTNGDKTLTPKVTNSHVPSRVPRLKVLNVSQIIRKANGSGACEIVPNPAALLKDGQPQITTAVPLTAELFKGKSPNPEAGSQVGKNPQKLGVRQQKRTVLRLPKDLDPIDPAGNLSPDRTTESDESISPTSDGALEPESGPWISTNDDWMKKGSNSRMYPTAEYIKCTDGNVPLLRAKVSSKSAQIPEVSMRQNASQRQVSDESSTSDEELDLLANTSKSQKVPQKSPTVKSKKIKKSRISAREKNPLEACVSPLTISDSDGEEEENEVNQTSRKEASRNVCKKTAPRRTKTSSLLEDPQPGPSGVTKHHRTETGIELDTDGDEVPTSSDEESVFLPKTSDDEESDTPVHPGKKRKHSHPAFDSEEDDPPVPRNKNSDSRTERPADDNSGRYADGRKKPQGPRPQKMKPTEYASNWRHDLESDRPVKMQVTRMKFTRAEQRIMVDFLCTFEDIELAQPKGYKVWAEMLKRGLLPHRTSQSLQNHFMKSLLPRIQLFFKDMSPEHRKQFLKLQTGTGRN